MSILRSTQNKEKNKETVPLPLLKWGVMNSRVGEAFTYSPLKQGEHPERRLGGRVLQTPPALRPKMAVPRAIGATAIPRPGEARPPNSSLGNSLVLRRTAGRAVSLSKRSSPSNSTGNAGKLRQIGGERPLAVSSRLAPRLALSPPTLRPGAAPVRPL